MAVWNLVYSDFNPENETINFGTRQLSEDDCLYETNTLTSIFPDGEVYTNPSVTARSCGQKVVVTVDNWIGVFDNVSCSNLQLSVAFDSRIDCFGVVGDGKLLVVALNTGKIVGMGTDNRQLFDVRFESDPYVAVLPVNETDFVLVTKRGRVYRVTVLNLLEDVELRLEHKVFVDVCDSICHASIYDDLLVLSGASLTVCDMNGDFITVERCTRIIKVYPLNNLSLLGLTEDGFIVIICALTLQEFVFYDDEPLSDIVFVGDRSGGEISLLALTRSDEIGNRYLQMMNFSDGRRANMSVQFRIKTSPFAITVDQVDINEELLFIEGIVNKCTSLVEELRVKVVVEGSPQIRLKRYLRHRKFDEAFNFAKLYSLEVETIWKAKADQFVDKLKCGDAEIEELVGVLEKIADVEFVVNACIYSTPETMLSVRKLLNYGTRRVRTHFENGLTLSLPQMWKWEQLNRSLHHLDTFAVYLQCNENDVDEFRNFLTVDLFEEITKYLRRGEIKTATIILSRLDYENRALFDENLTKHLLDAIPSQATLPELRVWFSYMIPDALSTFPESLPLFLNWLDRYVLQANENAADWPEAILRFSGDVLKLLKDGSDNSCLYDGSVDIFEGAVRTIRALEYAKTLKDTFKMKIKVQEFLREPAFVVQHLLGKLSPNSVRHFLDTFLHKFMIDHGLDSDVIISDYVKEVVANARRENVVASLLPCLQNLETRRRTTLYVLEKARIPWSRIVNEIADRAAAECSVMAEAVYGYRQNAGLNLMSKKYGWNRVNFDDKDEVYLFIKRILRCGYPEMLDDIEGVVKVQPLLREQSKMLCFYHFVGDRKFEEALQIIDGLEPNDTVRCCFSIFASKLLLDVYPNSTEVLSCIVNRLIKHDPQNREFYINEFRKQKNIRELKVCYNYIISECDYDNENKRKEVLYYLIEMLDETDFDVLIKRVVCITKLLDFDKEIGIARLFVQIHDVDKIAAICDELLDMEASPTILTSVAVALLNYMNCPDVSLPSLETTICSTDVLTSIRLYTLAHRLALVACIMSNADDFPACFEVAKWTAVAYDLIKEPVKILQQWKLSEMNPVENACLPSSVITTAFGNAFDLSVQLAGLHRNEPNVQLLMYESSVDEVDTLIDTLPSYIQSLHNDGFDFSVHSILNLLHSFSLSYLNSDERTVTLLTKIVSMKQHCVSKLVDKVLNSYKLNVPMAASLLECLTPEQEAKILPSIIQQSRLNIKRYRSILLLCLSYFKRHRKNRSCCTRFEEQIVRCNWWTRLCHSTFSLVDYFRSNPRELLRKLILSNKADLKTVQTFCTDFGLDVQEFLPYLLEKTLTNWTLETSYVTLKNGAKELVVHDSENVLLEKCSRILSAITNVQSVVENLYERLGEINFYNYEVYLCVIKLSEAIIPKSALKNHQLLLHFLKSYRRISKPNVFEISEWETNFPRASALDPLSEWRLPYRPMLFSNDIWKIIGPEINLATYERWFTFANLLGLDRNQVCTYAIKGSVTAQITSIDETTWTILPQHSDLFKSISECVARMTNLEMATTALFDLANSVPGGADLVVASLMCWQKAQEWADRTAGSTPNLKNVLTKIKKKYLLCSTMHVLHKYGLADKKYFNMCGNPEGLIHALYDDPRIVDSFNSACVSCPDINEAAGEIAHIYDLNFNNIRHSLFTAWLQTQDENDFLRLCFLCKRKEELPLSHALYKIGVDGTVLMENSVPTYPIKVRALECLLVVNTPSSLIEITVDSHEILKKRIGVLKILDGLDRCGLYMTETELDGCTKANLLNRLVQLCREQPQAVIVMADICVHYDLNLVKKWKFILQKMTSLKTVEKLGSLLLHVSTNMDVTILSAYGEAWRCVLLYPFSSVNQTVTEELRKKRVESLRLLQMHSYLNDEDLLQICRSCIASADAYMAAAVLPFLSTDKQNEVAESILNARNESFAEDLDKLLSHGIVSCYKANEIIQMHHVQRDRI